MLRLKHERIVRRWRQADVARLAEIPQPTVSDIERGDVMPSVEQLDRLARTFDIHPPALLLLPIAFERDGGEVHL